MKEKNTRFRNHQDRAPEFAGKFYPASKTELTKQLDELFTKARKKQDIKPPRALIVPHAGYIFSGEVAASAFNQLSAPAQYRRVFVLASSHQFIFDGAALFTTGDYLTPLGKVKVDIETAKRLMETSGIFKEDPGPHQFEHSLEVQLPFLQYKLGNHFLLVPIIIGTHNADDCKQIAKALKPWFAPDNLFVISTDFSHYPEYSEAVKNDALTADAICSNNPHILLNRLIKAKKEKIDHLTTSLCGWTSIMTLLYITKNQKVKYKEIAYQNSGDSKPYGDKNRVVGYWAISVYDQETVFSLSEEEKNELLQKARNAIKRYLKTGKRGNPEPPQTGGILTKQAGVFVSIYIDQKLRGCIGNFATEEILNDLVQKMAVSAACDHRFENLQSDELDKMKLEISVLSPLKKIKSIDEIELGKHGIYLKKGLNSGTFLPQVAQKTGWDLDQLLGHCAHDKAGLGWEGWKDAEIFTYEAVIIT